MDEFVRFVGIVRIQKRGSIMQLVKVRRRQQDLESIRIVLRGVGQVVFQENSYSGVLMLVGIFCCSYMAALVALGATISSTLMAHVLRYSRDAIRRGLYGFNGTLVGIALVCFIPSWPFVLLLLIPAAACSTLVAGWMSRQRMLPTLTAPFVALTWLILAVRPLFFNSLASSADGVVEHMRLLDAISFSYGQIMLQGESLATGAFIFIAILVNSWKMAVQSLVASVVSLSVLFIPSISMEAVNNGLYGYNTILAFLAIASVVKVYYGASYLAVLALVLSIAFQYIGLRFGLSTLTAPFVLSVWVTMLIDRALSRRDNCC